MDDLPEELRPLVDIMTSAALTEDNMARLFKKPPLIKFELIYYAIQAARRAGWTFTPPKGEGNDG